ncbi:putative chromosome-partitioning protein ParB [Candidatus Protochlamydia naegleriophila]|uniref:Putative chromosome-partitioning protein ParB n=1 Tax=Candidatus Protochlamydia naegleriophila TaxID=389348 RepID=A0A0U5JD43_9BACT|nr:ParB/RepB/Spo0J family partition protein [Candidatus Protochlamydia naegleriophila]CUI15702.1 putative chromosome-partitioning protein ParB [Candidatus Protochlamydia naegleriophila]
MQKEFPVESAQDDLREVFLTQIRINPYQPRRDFKPEELQELADSIKAVGIIHPPLVRPLADDDCYELIAGERRFRASQLAGLQTIPVFVRHTSYALSAQAALIENIQRVDLNPLEIAKALKQLMQDFNFNQDRLAQQIGKKRSTVANYLRLLALPYSIQTSILQGTISMGHAKAILALESEDKQQLLHDLILRDDLNVREAEQAATRIGEKAKKQQLSYVARDFYLEQLAEKIQHKLGTKVMIQGKGKRGRISIDYYNLDDLDRLLHLFGVKEEI